MADDIEALKLKITELENKLNELSSGPEPTDISAEEVAAYQKVVSQIPPIIRQCVTTCVTSCRGCGRGCGRGGCAQPCVVMALDDGEEMQGAVACGRGGCYMQPCIIRPCGGRSCGGRNCSQPCVALSGDEEMVQGAVACRGCGRGCSYCYYAHTQPCTPQAMPCAGAAQGTSRPRGGVGRFAHLGG